MDPFTSDGYTSYSDASTPRTPSPTDMHFNAPAQKHDFDSFPAIFNTDDDHTAAPVVVHPDGAYWPPSAPTFTFSHSNGNPTNPRTLLQELYEPEALTPEFQAQENTFQQQQQHQEWDPHGQQHQHRSGEFAMMRRATFPSVRYDRDDGAMPLQQYPSFMPPAHQMQHQNGHLMQNHPQHAENLLPSYPQRQEALDGGYNDNFIPSLSSSPHSSYRDFDDSTTSIKLEDTSSSLMVPAHPSHSQNFYRAHSNSSAGIAGHPSHNHGHGHGHGMPISYVSPHTGLPVQHTDDAASKETQYLRRRCFNCHTTEPPSWRRSTLNPGKIVCNKCGLYERTHLRPRPLRFDELRAGNKARKASKGGAAGASTSPKQGKMLVKKEPREYGPGGLVRRSSVSSASSVHSGSGASDWDDNVSIYSSGSAPPTSFNSPVTRNYPLSRDSNSPPQDGGIRLPKNPLSDIQGLSPHHQQSTTPLLPPTVPRKAHTSPVAFSANLSYSPSLNASAMPSVSESTVWSSEPEEQNGVEPGLGLVGSPELTAAS